MVIGIVVPVIIHIVVFVFVDVNMGIRCTLRPSAVLGTCRSNRNRVVRAKRMSPDHRMFHIRDQRTISVEITDWWTRLWLEVLGEQFISGFV